MSARRKPAAPTLFDAVPAAAVEPVRRPPDLAFIRKNLNWLLRVARNAEVMPWSASDTIKWEQLYPQLTAMLPSDEGERLLSEFRTELERLRAAR
jgi:hypothetical protein